MSGVTEPAVDTSNTKYPTALGRSRDGFMVQVMLHSLEIGLRTPSDFIRHFPPAVIMDALKERAVLRAKILVDATGTREKIANKMDAAASGVQLQIALDENVTTAEQIIELFEPDERVRYLSRTALWSYEIESGYWRKTSKEKDLFERAKTHTALVLRAALDNRLMTAKELVDAITLKALGSQLPKEVIMALIEKALSADEKFSEEHLIEAMPPSTLVEYFQLSTIWEKVVVPLLADAHDFVVKAQPAKAPEATAPVEQTPPKSSEGEEPPKA